MQARYTGKTVLCVSRAVLSVVLGAWSVRCVGWADWVDCGCFLSFVFLGDARRLELSPCNSERTIVRCCSEVGAQTLGTTVQGMGTIVQCCTVLGKPEQDDDWAFQALLRLLRN